MQAKNPKRGDSASNEGQAIQSQEEHRKATYRRPSLPTQSAVAMQNGTSKPGRSIKKDKGKKMPKAAISEQRPLLADRDTSGLTKAQKKNLLRTLKRKRAQAE